MITLVTNTPTVHLTKKDVARFLNGENELKHGILWKNVVCYNTPLARLRYRYTHLLVGNAMIHIHALVEQLQRWMWPISFELTYTDSETTWLSMRIPLQRGVTLEQRSIALTLMRMLSNEFRGAFYQIDDNLRNAYIRLSSYEDILRMVFRQAAYVYGHSYLYIGHLPYTGYVQTSGTKTVRLAAAERLALGVYRVIDGKLWDISGKLWGSNRFYTGITEYAVMKATEDEEARRIIDERAANQTWPL